MMKYFYYLLLSSLLITSLNKVSASNLPIFLNDLKWPPFFFPNLEKGQMGFGKEIITTCIKNQNYDITFKYLPIKRTHLYMKSGDIDVSIYSYNKERENFVYFGQEPLFTSSYGFATRKSDNITIETLSDINKYKFGHLAGLSHTKELRDMIAFKKAKNEISIGYDIDAMFGQLLTNPQRFQVMANNKETLKWRAKQLNISDKVTVHDYTIAEKPYYVAISKFTKNIKDPKNFLSTIDNCIKNIKQNNTYKTIASKYGL